MLTCELKRPRQREFIGPGGCVGIVAKTPKNAEMGGSAKKADQDISGYVADMAKMSHRMNWEYGSERCMHKSYINRKIGQALELRERVTEYRRAKLRELFCVETAKYYDEIVDSVETTEQRAEAFRKKAEELKKAKKRQIEMLREEKMNQKFILNNATIKDHVNRLRVQDIARDNRKQIELKHQILERNKKEDEWFACYWLKDAEIKAEQEKLEAEKQFLRKKENMKLMQQQWAANAVKKEQEKAQKQQEKEQIAKLMAELSVEAKELASNKKQDFADLKHSWDQAVEERRLKTEQERERDKLFSNFVLGNSSDKHTIDATKLAERKRLLQLEQKMYLKYHREFLEEERAQKERMEVLLNEYQDKAFSKREEEFRKRREARDNLRKEVQLSWDEQLKQKEAEKVEEKRKALELKEQLSKDILRRKQEETEAHQARLENFRQFGLTLRDQIEYNKQRREQLEQEDMRLQKAQEEAELKYQQYMDRMIEANKLDPKASWMRARFAGGHSDVLHWTGDLDCLMRNPKASTGLELKKNP